MCLRVCMVPETRLLECGCRVRNWRVLLRIVFVFFPVVAHSGNECPILLFTVDNYRNISCPRSIMLFREGSSPGHVDVKR